MVSSKRTGGRCGRVMVRRVCIQACQFTPSDAHRALAICVQLPKAIPIQTIINTTSLRWQATVHTQSGTFSAREAYSILCLFRLAHTILLHAPAI
jgi:hypothetical protein